MPFRSACGRSELPFFEWAKKGSRKKAHPGFAHRSQGGRCSLRHWPATGRHELSHPWPRTCVPCSRVGLRCSARTTGVCAGMHPCFSIFLAPRNGISATRCRKLRWWPRWPPPGRKMLLHFLHSGHPWPSGPLASGARSEDQPAGTCAGCARVAWISSNPSGIRPPTNAVPEAWQQSDRLRCNTAAIFPSCFCNLESLQSAPRCFVFHLKELPA